MLSFAIPLDDRVANNRPLSFRSTLPETQMERGRRVLTSLASRCPDPERGVTCILQGEASILLSVGPYGKKRSVLIEPHQALAEFIDIGDSAISLPFYRSVPADLTL